MSEGPFFIVDVRRSFRGDPYITVWRPDNAGYAYPLSWAGRYSRDQICDSPSYYHKLRYGSQRVLDRYPVPCSVVEGMAVPPEEGRIDGDAGPVIPNTAANRQALRRARFIPNPPADTKGMEDGPGA